ELGATSAPLAVMVTAAVPQSLACVPLTLTTTVGSKVQLHAIVTNSDSTTNDVTASATWTSSDKSVADFLGSDPTGVMTGLKAGPAKATPAYPGLTLSGGPCAITVQ